MSRLLTLGIYSVLIVIVLIIGVANASDGNADSSVTNPEPPLGLDIVPAGSAPSVVFTSFVLYDSSLCSYTLTLDYPYMAPDVLRCATAVKTRLKPSYVDETSRMSSDVATALAVVPFVEFNQNYAFCENAVTCYFVAIKLVPSSPYTYFCPPLNNPDYSLPTSKPDEVNSEGKYCKKPQENKCKQQTLNNPLDEDGINLYYYKSSLSGCFDGCTMTFKSDPDAEATYNLGGSVTGGLLASCGSNRCTGPLMQYDGTQCAGSDIQTTPEPTTSGAEPTTSGAEPTTSAAEPTTSGAEPTTSGAEPTTSGAEPTTSGGSSTSGSTGTDPNCYGTNQGDKCNGTSGSTGTGGGSGSGTGSGSGSGAGTSGGTGTGSGSGTGDDFGEKAAAYCKANPDSVVCAKLGTAEAEKITDDIITVSVTPDAGWGAATAQCPAPVKIDLGFLKAGASIDYSYANFCDFLTRLRMPVIGLAWLIAAFIMIGWRTSSGGDD